MNRAQINACAFAAAYHSAALFDYSVDNNLSFHRESAFTADSWPTIVCGTDANRQLFQSGFVVDILPNEIAQADEVMIPDSLLVQAISPCGFYSEKVLDIQHDYKELIGLLVSAIEWVIQDIHSDAALNKAEHRLV